MKKLAIALVMVGILMAAPMAFAASVNGTLVDAKNGTSPLKYGGLVIAYMWDEDNGTFNEVAVTEVAQGDTDFEIMDLAEGSYYFLIKAKGYMTEYYNDSLDFDNKEMIALAEDDDWPLDPIELTRTPFQFYDARLNIEEVPSGGKTLTLRASVLNTTASRRTLLGWFLVTTQGSKQYGAPMSSFMPVEPISKPKAINVNPNTYTQVSFQLKVPFTAPNDRTYTVTMYGGDSLWDPRMEAVEVGTFTKGDGGLQVVSTGGIPAKVSKSGKVLGWK